MCFTSPSTTRSAAVVAQHVADGRRDLPLREDAGGHLVQQRLEEVMVGAVDQRDPHRGPLQRPWRQRGRRSRDPMMTT